MKKYQGFLILLFGILLLIFFIPRILNISSSKEFVYSTLGFLVALILFGFVRFYKRKNTWLKNIFNVYSLMKTWKLFLWIVLSAIILTFAVQVLFVSEAIYYQSFGAQIDFERINKIVEYAHKYK